MIGKIVSAVAGQSVARTIGGTAAGPAGALVGAALPVVLPAVARRLGPAGMVAAAVGGLLFTRWLERRNARKKVAREARAPLPPVRRFDDHVAQERPIGLCRGAHTKADGHGADRSAAPRPLRLR